MSDNTKLDQSLQLMEIASDLLFNVPPLPEVNGRPTYNEWERNELLRKLDLAIAGVMRALTWLKGEDATVPEIWTVDLDSGAKAISNIIDTYGNDEIAARACAKAWGLRIK